MTETIALVVLAPAVIAIFMRQFIRERLVSELLAMKHPYALDVSDWTTITQFGYIKAVKIKYVWGSPSRELSRHTRTRLYIYLLRASDVIWVLSGLSVVAFLLYFNLLVLPAQP